MHIYFGLETLFKKGFKYTEIKGENLVLGWSKQKR
jgi:hypothetical protein